MAEFVTLSVDRGVGVIRLDRPPANAISIQVSNELADAVARCGELDEVGAIVVWGGAKLFAAGADIKEMAEDGPEQIAVRVGALNDAVDALEALPKVSIAAITGFALGGGFEIALACDLRFLAQDGSVGQPEIAIGVIPGAGGTQRLARLAPGSVRDLVLTGRGVSAEEALARGLVDAVHPSGEVLEAAVAAARRFAEGPHTALAAAKQAIRSAFETSGRAGFSRERELFVQLFGTADQREGMTAFIEKREPRFGA